MKSIKYWLAIALTFTVGSLAIAQITPVTEQFLEKNYLSNGGFESAAAGWAAYKNTAQAAPVSGTGGSPTTTITSSASSPLAGKASGIITHPASNAQGEGVSYAFSIDNAAKGRVLTISGLYQVVAGAYSGGTQSTDSDIELYIYDVDAAAVIQPAGYKLDGAVAGINYPLVATFQTNTTSSNYRLIFHSATTSTSSFQIKLDSLKIGLQSKLLGSPITDLTSYSASATPNFSGFGSVNAVDIRYQRRGNMLYVTGHATTSSPGSNAIQIPLPSGLSIDSSITTMQIVGQLNRVGNVSYAIWPLIGNGGNNYVNVGGALSAGTNAGSAQLTPQIGANVFNDPETEEFWFEVPIQGWSSSVLMSDSADTRVVSARYMTAAGQSIASGAVPVIDFGSSAIDTHGAVTTGSSWKFTAPVSGIYRVSTLITYGTASFTSGLDIRVALYKNGTEYTRLSHLNIVTTGSQFPSTAGSAIISLNAGDFIDVRSFHGESTARSLANDAKLNHIQIERLSGPSQIAASEKIAFHYYSNSAQTVDTTTGGKPMDFAVKVLDTHGAVTGAGSGFNGSWKFTAPAAGIYFFKGAVTYGAGCTPADVSDRGWYLYIKKNGSTTVGFGVIFTFGTTQTATGQPQATAVVQMNAGDYVQLYAEQNVTNTTCSANAALAENTYFEGFRIGN
jgi:hypothetical protein